MIIGMFLRNVKTYRKITYIPISDGEKFCGLLGDNGAGKSSILEALDSFFNDRPINPNLSYKQTPDPKNLPHLVPIFLLKKTLFSAEEALTLQPMHDFLMHANDKTDVPRPNISQLKKFLEHRDSLLKYTDTDEYFLIALGKDFLSNINLSIFHRINIYYTNEEIQDDNVLTLYNEILGKIYTKIKEHFEYIYIPREINTETFTQLETNEIQKLMGENLYEELEKLITVANIKEINQKLNSYIDNLSNDLVEYTYRTSGQRQQNLKAQQLYNLVIQAFFNIRKLCKKENNDWLEIHKLSSGEKQKALLDIAENLLEKRNANKQNVILAIDEPESSLHMSSCYEVFNQFHNMSSNCHQLLFTTHWYGFLPIISNGNSTVITKANDDSHTADLVNLYHYKEQIKSLTASSKGSFPSNIRLKSTNDLVQSIITSSTSDEPYNWLICEGSSDKVYLNYYLNDLVETKKLRIIPVGSASAIKQLYSYISTAYEDFKTEIKGKIFLLTDTDEQLVSFSVKNDDQHKNLRCKRLANSEAEFNTHLVKIDDNKMTSPTVIEDVLNGDIYSKTLELFKDEYKMDFLEAAQFYKQYCSAWCYVLPPHHKKEIKNFFKEDGIKYKFSKSYIELAKLHDHEIPDWIQELYEWFDK